MTPLEDEPAVPDYKEFDEKCFIRVKNYRDPLIVGADASIETTNQQNTNQSVDRVSANQTPDGIRKSQEEFKKDSISETASQKEIREIEAFNFDAIPQKVLMI